VLDLRDLFADQLAEWVDEWCEKHALRGPKRHDVATDSEFLLTWLPGICRLDWIGDWFEQVAETLIDAHALAPWRPAVRRVPGVPCPGCGESNLVIYGGRVRHHVPELQDPDDRGAVRDVGASAADGA
jgi:hypothetical protein